MRRRGGDDVDIVEDVEGWGLGEGREGDPVVVFSVVAVVADDVGMFPSIVGYVGLLSGVRWSSHIMSCQVESRIREKERKKEKRKTTPDPSHANSLVLLAPHRTPSSPILLTVISGCREAKTLSGRKLGTCQIL